MKIKKRTGEEKTNLGRMGRENNIREAFNSIFSKKSIDEEDEETILEWASQIPNKQRLVYLLEKLKVEALKEI